MSTRRQFFRMLGGGALVAAAPGALTEAIASVAPQVVADPMGDWLPLDGAQVDVAEVPELAKALPKWVKDGKVELPLMQATTREVQYWSVPADASHTHGYSSPSPNHTHGFVAAEARWVERPLPARYMVKARPGGDLPLGTILLFGV